MNLILGIDTGGTYTDGVLLDYATKKIVASAKAFTTKEDLTIGIEECINLLDYKKHGDVCIVSLSTTLATNAVVEKKDIPAGLITIGESASRSYPVLIKTAVGGKLDVMGREVMPVNEEEIKAALCNMKGKVKALAISGYASVRNPQHELAVCSQAQKILDVPVVCAHELTNSLGYYERTVTAVLNAKLTPIIAELIVKTRKVLEDKCIKAPIIIIKGDGHLMTENFAMGHPVETVLSGPAASMMGGKFLTGLQDAIVVDMGGTTTDIVFLDKGEVSIKSEGATVGGWQTRVKAVEVKSYGFGGDSYIRLDTNGDLKIEPYRVIPLCVEADRSPDIYEEIKRLKKGREYTLTGRMETDCFRLFKAKDMSSLKLNEVQKGVLGLLKNGAHSALYLAEKLNTDIDSLGVTDLMKHELIQMISMTPTDLLHATGEFRQWNHKASVLGLAMYADAAGKEYKTFLKEAEDACVYKMCYIIMQSVLEMDGLNMERCGSDVGKFIIDTLLGQNSGCTLKCNGSFIKPIIGIGAPADAWVRKAAHMMNTQYILPEFSSVANAVGASVSDVRESVDAFIHMDHLVKKYVAFLPEKKLMFDTIEEAKEYCRADVRSCAEYLAEKLALASPEIILNEEDEYINNVCNENEFLRTCIKATIVGEVNIVH